MEKPIVFGLEVEEIEEGLTPTSIILVMECTDLESGDDYTIIRSSDGLTVHQAIGMLIDALDQTREEAREARE